MGPSFKVWHYIFGHTIQYIQFHQFQLWGHLHLVRLLGWCVWKSLVGLWGWGYWYCMWVWVWGGVAGKESHGCRDIPCCLVLAPHPTWGHPVLSLGGLLCPQSLLLTLVECFIKGKLPVDPFSEMAGLLDVSGWRVRAGAGLQCSQLGWRRPLLRTWSRCRPVLWCGAGAHNQCHSCTLHYGICRALSNSKSRGSHHPC